MTKTIALLLDSYRELNAKRLFWIVLVISGLVVCSFAMIGNDSGSLTIFWWKTPIRLGLLSLMDPAYLYKEMFSIFGVGIWLAWVANIMALASTAGIFPDFLAEGSIDLYLSKPIGRLRLFLMRYLGGMLFVTLQVTIFSICSFLVLGWRGKVWLPGVFLAIPIVVLVFSYLFSVCVLLGVITRSTVAALLLTLLAWLVIFGVEAADSVLLQQMIATNLRAASLDRQIEDAKLDLDNFSTSKPSVAPKATGNFAWVRNAIPFGLASGRQSKADLQANLDELRTRRQEMTGVIEKMHTVVYDVLLFLPKTSATTQLLDRELLSDDQRFETAESPPSSLTAPQPPEGEVRGRRDRRRAEMEYLQAAAMKIQNKRSSAVILLSSIGFEAVMLGIAGWIFCRRDY